MPDRPLFSRYFPAIPARYILYPLLLIFAIACMTLRPIAEFDFWFHAALGKYVITNRALPHTDVFSFTAVGRPFVSTGWLSAVLLYLLYARIPFPWEGAGPALLVFVLVAGGYLAAYFYSIQRLRSNGLVVLALLAGLLVACLRFTPRPDVWSQFLIGITLLILMAAQPRARNETMSPTDGADGNTRLLWILPPLFLLWANLHPGFIAGLVCVMLFGFYETGRWFRTRERKHLRAVLPCALCMAVWLVNPYGSGILTIAGTIRAVPHLQERIREYMPIYLSGHPLPLPVYIAFTVLVLSYVVVVLGNRSRIPWWQAAVAAFVLVLTVLQRRQLGLAGLVFPILMLPHLANLENQLKRYQRLLPAAAVIGTVIVCLAQYQVIRPKHWPGFGCNRSDFPYALTQFLKRNPSPANMFNPYRFGGYLMYHLWPESKVFIDGRIDVYGHDVWQDYLDLAEGRFAVEEFSEKYHIKTFVIDITSGWNATVHPANQLSTNPAWKLVYFDDLSAVFVDSREGEGRTYAEAHDLGPVTPFAPQRLIDAVKAGPPARVEVFDKLDRVLTASAESANALTLAAMAEFAAGKLSEAQHFFYTAQHADPACPLLNSPLMAALRQ